MTGTCAWQPARIEPISCIGYAGSGKSTKSFAFVTAPGRCACRPGPDRAHNGLRIDRHSEAALHEVRDRLAEGLESAADGRILLVRQFPHRLVHRINDELGRLLVRVADAEVDHVRVSRDPPRFLRSISSKRNGGNAFKRCERMSRGAGGGAGWTESVADMVPFSDGSRACGGEQASRGHKDMGKRLDFRLAGTRVSHGSDPVQTEDPPKKAHHRRVEVIEHRRRVPRGKASRRSPPVRRQSGDTDGDDHHAHGHDDQTR